MTDARAREVIKYMLDGHKFHSGGHAADAILAALAEAGITLGQETDTPPEKWPTRGPDFNQWNGEIFSFLRFVLSDKWTWSKCLRFKYIQLIVDTRDGAFRILDRDRVAASAEQVLEQLCASPPQGADQPAPADTPAGAGNTSEAT